MIAARQEDPPSMRQLVTESDNGRTIQLHPQDELDLQLNESRMGGYRWTLVEAGEPVLRRQNIEKTTTQTAASKLGMPNMRTWQFTAEQPGSARLRLRQQRSWESESAGSEFRLTVEVAA
jgi:predicted secreted protein